MTVLPFNDPLGLSGHLIHSMYIEREFPFTGHHKSNNVDALACHKVAARPLDFPSLNPTLTFKMKAGLYSSVFRFPNKILEDQFSVHITQTTTYFINKHSHCLSEIKTDNLSFRFKKRFYFLNLAILLKIDSFYETNILIEMFIIHSLFSYLFFLNYET